MEDLSGKEFGRLTVREYCPEDGKWLCDCSCGGTKRTTTRRLRSGKVSVKSCGCLHKEGLRQRRWKGCGQISGSYWYAIKKDAARRQIPFELTIEYAWELYQAQQARCALSDLPLTLQGGTYRGTASLDRIDSSVGYVAGNVQWLHKDVNIMKHVHSVEYFVSLCNQITDFQREKRAANTAGCGSI